MVIGADDLLQDVARAFGPDEWFGFDVVMRDVFVDRLDQVWHTFKDPAAKPLRREVTEETLHHIEPRRGSGRKVYDDPRVLGQPFQNRRVFVCGVVVGHQMQGLVLRCFAVDLFEELQPFGVAVARLALADPLAVEQVKRGEQCRGSVAFIRLFAIWSG